MSVPIKIARTHDDAVLPHRHHSGDAYDICAVEFRRIVAGDILCPPESAQVLYPGYMTKAYTGLVVAIPEGYRLDVKARSGLAMQGLAIINGPGRIDTQYRGEICIILGNVGQQAIKLEKGKSIAQIDLERAREIDWQGAIVENIADTDRQDGGFGSTDKKKDS
jgi:dUTP pyrophosphatase